MEITKKSLVLNVENIEKETTNVETTNSISGLCVCLYTDGGCKPSRGIGGWGIHGYTFFKSPPKQGSGCPKAKVTDYGYSPTSRSDEVTVVEYVDGWGSLIPESTNNIAELMACIKAFEFILKNEFVFAIVILDSNYVLDNLLNNLPNWKNNNWKKSDGNVIENKAFWEKIDSLYSEIENSPTEITFSKVKGHSGDVGNDKADYHASRGIIAGRKGFEKEELIVTPAKGYWSNKSSYNRLISQGNWYFNTNVEAPKSNDGRTVYHQGNHGDDDDFLMKPISDNCFSVIFINPDPILETLRTHQNFIDKSNLNSIVVANLNNITKGNVYSDIEKNGSLFIHQLNDKKDLYNSEGLLLTKELRPARLAINTIDKLTILENILEWFLEDENKYSIKSTNITDVIYERVLKGNKVTTKLKPTITPGSCELIVPVDYKLGNKEGSSKLKLTINIDTPNRNTLSALTDVNPEVHVITWYESDKAFRYGTIIKTDNGVGIWAGFFSNIHILL